MSEALHWTPHPLLSLPTDEEILWLAENDPDELLTWYDQRENIIRMATEDPLRHGFTLDSWERIRWGLRNYNEVLALGGNRSSKTTGWARLLMEAISSLNDGHLVCFSQNADTSVKVQQAAMWEMMPKEFKKKTKSMDGYINYSMQNGFTGASFIFPDTRTRVDFKTYTQFSNNPTILEGFSFGFPSQHGLVDRPELNIGAWLDEYLGDDRLVNTLRFRLATLNSKMGLGFTPIDGYTPFIAQYLKNVQTLETRPAELLEGKPMPTKQYSPENDAAVVYLHTDENPFGGYERLAKDLKGKGEEEIMVRAYGYPVKSTTGLLPLFNTRVNVLDDEPNEYGMRFPDLSDPVARKKFTAYQVVDPAGARNYVAIWAVVNKESDVYIVDEWPNLGNFGDWALYGDPKWTYGPAAKKVGHNVASYVELFKEIEETRHLQVFERIGDSRFFAKENEDNDDLFTVFSDHGMDFVPASGKREDTGITALDDWFTYNPDVAVDQANKPRCFIHKRCGNLISTLINYNAEGKRDEALKDWMDLMRYLRQHNQGQGPDHIEPNQLKATGPRKLY
jgi:hypothetical protein